MVPGFSVAAISTIIQFVLSACRFPAVSPNGLPRFCRFHFDASGVPNGFFRFCRFHKWGFPVFSVSGKGFFGFLGFPVFRNWSIWVFSVLRLFQFLRFRVNMGFLVSEMGFFGFRNGVFRFLKWVLSGYEMVFSFFSVSAICPYGFFRVFRFPSMPKSVFSVSGSFSVFNLFQCFQCFSGFHDFLSFQVFFQALAGSGRPWQALTGPGRPWQVWTYTHV